MWYDAWRYDLADGWMDDDLPFWTDLLQRRRPTRVLDLACGTGRITFALATRGVALDPDFRIVGLDSSAPFLASAHDKLGALDPAVAAATSFVEADMRHFALSDRFDLIVLGFNSFAYLPTTDDQLACLAAVRRHLAPGGHFGLDLVVPHLDFLAEAQTPVPPMRVQVDLVAPVSGVRRFVRAYTDRYDAMAQTVRTTNFDEIHHDDGRQERFLDDLVWRMTFPQELELLLRHAGLVPTERFGTYDRAPFSARSKLYLWLTEASPVGAPPMTT